MEPTGREDRARRAGSARIGWAKFGVAWAFLVNGVMFGSWASRIPILKEQAGLDSAQLGFALLCGSGGAVMAMTFAGALAGRRGSVIVTIGGLLGSAAALPFLGIAASWPAMAGSLLVLGSFQGSMDVAMNANALAVEQASGTPIMSRLHGTWSVGSFTGALLTAAAEGVGISMQYQFVFLAVALAASSALLQHTMLHEGLVEAGSGFRRPPRRLLALGVMSFCGMLAEGSAGDWSGVYMRTSVLSTEQQAAIALGAFSAAMALSRLAGDRLTQLLGGGRLVSTGALVSAVGLCAALAFQSVLPSIAGFALMGLGLGAVVPVALRAAGSQPGVPSAIGIAAVATMGYAGLLSGPPIIGTVAGVTGLRAALAIVVVLLAALAATAGRAVGSSVTAPEPAVPTELP